MKWRRLKKYYSVYLDIDYILQQFVLRIKKEVRKIIQTFFYFEYI